MTVTGREIVRQGRLRVAEVVHETPDARSVVFDLLPGDDDWFRYRPGQFVTIKVPHPDGAVARSYSLSSAPGDDRPAITIKRAGPASAWLCDNVTPGWTLEMLPPAGLFTPASVDDDLLLIAAGSGITPIMSIVRAVMASGSAHIALLYANRDADSVIFARQLELLSIRHTGRLRVLPWLESENGLPTCDALVPLLEPYAGREVYLCGPAAFMTEASQTLGRLGVPRRQVHRERFVSLEGDPFSEAGTQAPEGAPAEKTGDRADEPVVEGAGAPAGCGDHDPAAGGAVVEVVLDGRPHRLPWPADTRLLDLLGDSGLAVPSSCRSGQCGACTTRLAEGDVRMLANDVLDAEDLADGYILACQAVPASDLVRVSYD